MNYYNLTYEDIIKINLWCQEIVSYEIDFTEGIRDYNLLKSIPVSINQCFAEEELYPTVYDKSACVWFSLTKYHCFVDGNKRTALVTTIVYLFLNGFSMAINKVDLYNTCISIASGKMQPDQIITYLKIHTTIIPQVLDAKINITEILDTLSENQKFICILRELGK